jgi:hypothetical protein
VRDIGVGNSETLYHELVNHQLFVGTRVTMAPDLETLVPFLLHHEHAKSLKGIKNILMTLKNSHLIDDFFPQFDPLSFRLYISIYFSTFYCRKEHISSEQHSPKFNSVC